VDDAISFFLSGNEKGRNCHCRIIILFWFLSNHFKNFVRPLLIAGAQFQTFWGKIRFWIGITQCAATMKPASVKGMK